MPSRAEVYQGYAYPILEKLDAERVHNLSIHALALCESHPYLLSLLAKLGCEQGKRFENEQLKVSVGGVIFENPFSLAAGFDKQGKTADSLYRLGFSSVVVGSVTRYPQPGNTKPRIFRPNSKSLLNMMGFPSEGVSAMKMSLKHYKDRNYPIGVSIGLNKGVPLNKAAMAYFAVAQELSELADFFEINVSSPNTEKLRDLQKKEYLENIVRQMRSATSLPLFLKVSPDLTLKQLDNVIAVAESHNLAIVATNTSANPSIKSELGEQWENKQGGISGAAVEQISNFVIKHIAHESNVDVVGVGGVYDLQSALRKFEAGAKSLQVYSGFVMESGGPTFPSRLNRELAEWMEKRGVASVSDLVGQKL